MVDAILGVFRKVMFLNAGERLHNGLLKGRRVAVKVFHHLGIDVATNLLLMKLDDIHNLVIGKVGPEFRNRVACQFEEKLSLLVIVDFREVDQFVYDDIFGRIKDDPAFSITISIPFSCSLNFLTRISSETG